MKFNSFLVLFIFSALLSTLLVTQVLAFKSGYIYEKVHRKIIESAFSKEGFNKKNLEIIVKGADSQDAISSSKFTDSPTHHFDDNLLSQSISYFKDRFSKAADYSRSVYKNFGSAEQTQRVRKVLFTFGEGLHTVQDFYSHSNYVELLAVSGNKDVIVNWSKLPAKVKTGYFYWNGYSDNESTRSRKVCVRKITNLYKAKGKNLTFHSEQSWKKRENSKNLKTCTDYVLDPRYQVLHYELNKDDANQHAGAVMLPDKRTMHAKARYLAKLETKRQWKDFKKSVKKKYGKRSQLILPALKGHSLPKIKLKVEMPTKVSEGKGASCQCWVTLTESQQNTAIKNNSKYDIELKAIVFKDNQVEAKVKNILDKRTVGSTISIAFNLPPLSGAGKRRVLLKAMYAGDTKYGYAKKYKELTVGDDKLLNSKWSINAYFGGSMGTRKYSIKVLNDNPNNFSVRVMGHRKGDTPAIFKGIKSANRINLNGWKAVKEKKLVDHDGSIDKMNAGRVIETGRVIKQKFKVRVLLNKDQSAVSGTIRKDKKFRGKRIK